MFAHRASGTTARAPADARARPRRQEAAVLLPRRAPAGVRVGDQGVLRASRHADRDRPRRDAVRTSCTATCRARRRSTAASPGRARRRVVTVDADGRIAQRPLLAADVSRRAAARAADRDRRAARERVRELVTRGRRAPADQRRAARRVPERRRRLDDRRRPDEPADARAGEDVQHRLRGRRRLRRDRRTRAGRRDGSTPTTPSSVSPSAIDLIDTLIWHHDGPFGDSSAIPTYLVSQLTRAARDGRADRRRRRRGVRRLPAVSAPALAAERVAARWPAASLTAALVAAAGAAERAALAGARAALRAVHAPAAARAADALEQLLLRRSARRCCAGLRCARRADRSAATSRGAMRDELARLSPLSQLLHANFALVPARRSAGQDRPLHDGEFARGALAVSRSRADRVRRRAARRVQAARPPDQGDPARRVRRPDSAERSIDAARWDSACRSTPGSAASCATTCATRCSRRDARCRAYLRAGRRRRRSIDDHLGRARANCGHALWSLVCFERWLQLLPGVDRASGDRR